LGPKIKPKVASVSQIPNVRMDNTSCIYRNAAILCLILVLRLSEGFQVASLRGLQPAGLVSSSRKALSLTWATLTTDVSNESVTDKAPEEGPLLPKRLSQVERARTVTHVCKSGTLCTSNADPNTAQGVPFGSFVDFIIDSNGWPVFLLSDQSLHSMNMAANPEASVSLFCQQPAPTTSSSKKDVASNKSSVLAATRPRVTIVGTVEPIDDLDELCILRPAFSVAHTYADQLIDLPSFRFCRLKPESVYFVGGFGVSSEWVPVEDYEKARPDILAFEAPAITAKINSEKQQDLERTILQFTDVDKVETATVVALDRLGLDVRVKCPTCTAEYRLGFRQEVMSEEDAKSEIVKIFQEAWEREQGYEWALDLGPPVVKYASVCQ